MYLVLALNIHCRVLIIHSKKKREFYGNLWENNKRPRFDPWAGKIHRRRDRIPIPVFLDYPCGSAGKESTCNAGDLGLIPGLGRSPGEGKGYPLQYSGLENSVDRVVQGLKESDTTEQLSLRFMRKWGLPWWLSVNNLPANAGDASLIPGSEIYPGEGNGNLLQYSCMENPMDRGSWWTIAMGLQRVGHNLATKQEKWQWENRSNTYLLTAIVWEVKFKICSGFLLRQSSPILHLSNLLNI